MFNKPIDGSSSGPGTSGASRFSDLSPEHTNETASVSFIVSSHAVLNRDESPSPPDTFGSASTARSNTTVGNPVFESERAGLELPAVVRGEDQCHREQASLGHSDPHSDPPPAAAAAAAASAAHHAEGQVSASAIIARQMEAVKKEMRSNECQWRVIGELGKGGFGVVFKVRLAVWQCSHLFSYV